MRRTKETFRGKKLALSKESLKQLTTQELVYAVGAAGKGPTAVTCLAGKGPTNVGCFG